jgi:hypothetical protein
LRRYSTELENSAGIGNTGKISGELMLYVSILSAISIVFVITSG